MTTGNITLSVVGQPLPDELEGTEATGPCAALHMKWTRARRDVVCAKVYGTRRDSIGRADRNARSQRSRWKPKADRTILWL